MRKNLLKATLAVALFALPGQARADSPNLSGFSTNTTFFAPLGVTSFDVQFLFGRAGLSSTLLYQAAGTTTWTKILSTVGAFPNQTTTPAPGTIFSFSIVGNNQAITFALCNGNTASQSGSLVCASTTPDQPGPFFTGGASTQVRSLTQAQWNAARATAEGVNSAYNTVFGYEDTIISSANSDRDFNDVVFSTNLSTVVPEPATVVLVTAGLLGLAAAARRRKQNV